MAKQNIDPEAYKTIARVSESIRGGAISKLPSAMDIVLGQAKESGSPNLIGNVTNLAEEGGPAFINATNELLDCVDEYLRKNKSIMDALGVEV